MVRLRKTCAVSRWFSLQKFPSRQLPRFSTNFLHTCRNVQFLSSLHRGCMLQSAQSRNSRNILIYTNQKAEFTIRQKVKPLKTISSHSIQVDKYLISDYRISTGAIKENIYQYIRKMKSITYHSYSNQGHRGLNKDRDLEIDIWKGWLLRLDLSPRWTIF